MVPTHRPAEAVQSARWTPGTASWSRAVGHLAVVGLHAVSVRVRCAGRGRGGRLALPAPGSIGPLSAVPRRSYRLAVRYQPGDPWTAPRAELRPGSNKSGVQPLAGLPAFTRTTFGVGGGVEKKLVHGGEAVVQPLVDAGAELFDSVGGQ